MLRLQASPAAPRSGATLTEVLMAVLIMSIGVVSVISLFPMSVIRALQATQLTNSKFAEQNAEQIITTRPGILYGNAPEWTPAVIYTPDVDVVIPPTPIGSHTPASPKRFLCRDTTAGAVSPLYSGYAELDWAHPVLYTFGDLDGDGLFNDYVVYDTQDGDLDGEADIVWQVDTRARVIDPYGALLIEGGVAGTFSPEFGNIDFTPPGDAIARLNPFASLATTADQLNAADAMFALPDSWVLDLEAIPVDVIPPDSASTTLGTVELPADPGFVYAGAWRVTLVNINGTQVASRPIDAVSSGGTTVAFSWPDLPLSLDGDADGAVDIDDISSVRIEHFERRYTWLYTVSQADANQQSRVSCVVFFNRGFSLDDEFVYDANFGNMSGTIDVDDDGTAGGAGDTVIAPNQVRIAWDASTDPRPNIRWGRYIFDARAGHWYQILSTDALYETATTCYALLTLSDAVYSVTPDGQTASGGGGAGRAMVPKGVIHVFDLEL